MSLSSTLSSTATNIVSKFNDPAMQEGASLTSAVQAGASDASAAAGSFGSDAGNSIVSKFYDPALTGTGSTSGQTAATDVSNTGTAFSYGSPSPSASDASSATDGATSAQGSGTTDLSTLLQNLLAEVMSLISQMMPSSQDSDGTSTGSGTAGNDAIGSPAAAAAPVATGAPTADTAAPANAAPAANSSPAATAAPAATSAPDAAAAPATTAPGSAASSVGDGPTVGTGPRSFNITNTQDKPITLGQFDQNNQLVSQMTLQPGQTGQMKAENDTTGVIKQADADGNFQNDASRLEYYNGYINTSDIDGRNASISATDNNGFNIGDSQSIADQAPAAVTTEDSAGNKTVAGYYDGSTATMNQGADYMINALSQNGQSATGETYFHPNDDTLGQGDNPMRHTDSMSVDVSFGKA